MVEAPGRERDEPDAPKLEEGKCGEKASEGELAEIVEHFLKGMSVYLEEKEVLVGERVLSRGSRGWTGS